MLARPLGLADMPKVMARPLALMLALGVALSPFVK